MKAIKKYSWLMAIALLSLAAIGFVWVGSVQAQPIKTQVVEYTQGDAILEGYLAYNPSLEGERPGVLVVHDWLGLKDFERQKAEQLAKMGYVALAADIYGKGIRPQNRDEAREQATIYVSNRQLLRDRANTALEVLRNHPFSKNNRLAAIGYCFGGTTVLELARSGAEVAGVVSFHGNLDTPNPSDANNIKGKVLVLHGADDPLVPPQQVAAFQAEMRQANVDWQMISYGNAVHSFTNPQAGNDPSKAIAYNQKADKRSWDAMKLFFDETLHQQ